MTFTIPINALMFSITFTIINSISSSLIGKRTQVYVLVTLLLFLTIFRKKLLNSNLFCESLNEKCDNNDTDIKRYPKRLHF